MELHIPEADLAVRTMPRGSPEHCSAEEAFTTSGGKVALPHRAAWQETQPAISSLAVEVRDSIAERTLALFCADRLPSRMFKGFDILRVERFGEFGDQRAAEGAVRALAAVISRSRRLVRARTEVFCRDPEELLQVGRLLSQQGFARSLAPRCYERTGLIDLHPTLDEISRGLHKTARRHIRAVGKNPVEIRQITDPALAGRMSALMTDTFARSGAKPDPRDWGPLIRFSMDHPHLSRLAGLFRTGGGAPAPDTLLAFVWGAHHGDTAEYVAGASTRAPDVKMPLSYGLMWDLIEWAWRGGATWFDLGGITGGSHGSDDPVGGISDFKRYFRPEVHTVGAEFTLAGSTTLGALSRAVERARHIRG